MIAKNAVVPTDIYLGDAFDTLIITGPNTGGKTVALKTLGLFTLMAMCGLMIPAAEGSQISILKMCWLILEMSRVLNKIYPLFRHTW